MAQSTRENVEILIHTSAPSRGQDDARYRAFARAYLDFEPATKIQLQGANQEEPDVQARVETLHSTEEYDENASYRPPTQDPETNPGAHQNEITEEELTDLVYSPQLSFRSVLDNRDSPMFRTRSLTAVNLGMQSGDQMLRQSRVRSSFSAHGRSSSVIEDSMPQNNRTFPEFSSPTRILEHHLQQGQSTQDSPDVSKRSQFTDESSLKLEVPQAMPVYSSRSSDARTNPGSFSLLSPGRYQTISPPRLHKTRDRHITPSPILSSTTNTPNAMNSDNSDNLPASVQHANITNRCKSQNMETEDTSELLNEDMNSVRSSESGPMSGTPEIPDTPSALPRHAISKRRRVDFPSSIDKSPKRVKLVISDTAAKTSSASFPTPQTPLMLQPPTSSSLSPKFIATFTIPQIVPPTSSKDLTPASLITPSLGQLNSIPGLQNVFNPTLQTRNCLPFERGYWLVDTQTMDRKERLWSYLLTHISGGFSGWGVSAERSEDWKSIRVNCWGGVIKEIYLLLYIGSEAKIKGEFACWKDGDGETVVSWT